MCSRHYFLNFIALTILCMCPSLNPSNILVISPVVSKSHFIVGEAITIVLAEAGHNVTIISPYDYKPNKPNIEPIQIKSTLEKHKETMQRLQNWYWDLDFYQMIPAMLYLPILLTMGSDLCSLTVSDSNFKTINRRQYDLVIVEIFSTESLLGLGQQFNAPVIAYSAFSTSRWMNDLIGNPSDLSYISHPLLDFPDKMNFWQRVGNTLFYVYESILLTVLHHPLQRSIYNAAFTAAKLTYDEARKNVSLIFVNSHSSLARTLPYDLKDFIESAKDGVVCFSLGSFLKSTDFPIKKRDAFINAFSKIKQKIIWKFEDKTISMPKNVFTSSWLPQNDILAHPNVMALISHGGLLCVTEAAYHGKPILGIPFLGDTRLIMKRASEDGWAITLDYDNITTVSVEWALNEILDNKKYLENAKAISQRYRDQPMTPSETMLYWSEYIIRHKGAPHLRSMSLDLNYFQYHNFDVVLALIGFIFIVIYAIKWRLYEYQ